MKFALEESDAAAEHLTSELSAVQVCCTLPAYMVACLW